MTSTATAEVFVTTKAHKEAGQGGIGRWFDLRDYSDAKVFHVTARQWCEDELPNQDGSQTVPYFNDFSVSFLEKHDSECNFDVDTLLSGEEINTQVWSLLQMSDGDRELLNAYALSAPKHDNLFTSSKMGAEDMGVKLSNAKRQLAGKFESYADFGKALFEKAGFADDMPKELFTAIDFNRVADVLGNDITETNGYYFYVN